MTSAALDRARDGSERAFRELVEPYRRELHVHCYRMLGSLADAEDVLQETMLAAWRGFGDFSGRSSLRTWLYRIATNRCLNAIRTSRRRAPVEPVPPFAPPEPSRRSHVTWLQPYPDALLEEAMERSPGPAATYLAREMVELAFVTVLQELPPRQVAALLLCDVLDFSIAEVAPMLSTTVGAVKGALQRARASVAEHRRSRGAHQPPGRSRQEWDLARRFGRAFSEDDVAGLVELLTDDAWLAMPPAPHEYHGRAAIGDFWRHSAAGRAGRRFHLVPTRANTQPAFACYLRDLSGGPAHFTGVVVLTLTDGGVGGVTRFLDRDLAHPFALSHSLEPTTAGGPVEAGAR